MSRYYKAEDIEREIERLLQFKDENDFDFGTKHGIETVDRALKDLPTIETSEDCISRAWLEDNAEEFGGYYEETVYAVPLSVLENAPSVIPKEKEVIYGDEHNCIMTLFGECSYSETGCGDCAVVKKVREALAKTQMKTQNSNEKPKEGEWYRQTTDHFDYWECSECGIGVGLDDIKNFCPNCGADMRKGAANEDQRVGNSDRFGKERIDGYCFSVDRVGSAEEKNGQCRSIP